MLFTTFVIDLHMSSVIQFSKIDFFFVWKISLPKLNRKCSITLYLFLYFLLRKEVIHPHVPVGIPCYDLTPVIGPTFDGSLLTVMPPASGITDSHGLTGGVYKARERIHRSVADLRLLATPPSRSRVADFDPN